MKTLVIYPGRFQPFHKGHAQVFQWLKNKFGDAYIATSDKVEAPKSPFNFQEKKQMMRLAGVPAGKIKQVLNPYMAREILKDFDPKTTVLIFAVSQKDMEEDPRFSFKATKSGKPGYLQPYAGNEKKLKPFGDATKMQGYVIVTPTFTFNVLGKPATSASELRKQFVSLDNKKQKEFITDLFGKYDADIHKLMKKKIGDMIGKTKTIKQLKEEITRKQLAPMLDSFVSFASDKLGLKSMPSVRYKTGDDSYNSFAAYNPGSNELSISTANRHPMDIFRSVAHELVHHKQNEDGRLGKDIAKEGATGSDIENEANLEAGKIMRWFAKSNPDMFGKSYVVETNTAAMAPVGGIRGLGNVTGEISPDGESQYVKNNILDTTRLQSNVTDGLWYSDDPNDPFNWYDRKESLKHKTNAAKGFKVVRSQLNEGINDPGKLKAIFLAGGPGSGKDYVMNSVLTGEGLKEINSDVAFEYLMQKNGLDMEMPDEERVERDIVRGRAKNITKEQERLSLAGRLGLIINGTADDLEKIKTIKKNLENDGYETMMVFVNTSNEVSRERNVERGKMGKRKVPDGTDKQGVPDNSPNIRQEKWDLAQKNIGELQKIFGNQNFAVIDNTADMRKVAPEEKEKIQSNFNRVRRMAQQFVRAENTNPNAKKWIESEAQKRGITNYQEPKRYKTLTQIRQDVPQVVHKPDNDLMTQARRLGLSYYGFGRFGRKVGNENKVLYHSKGGKLVRVQTMNEEKKMKNDPCWKGYEMIGKKKKNGREVPNCVPANEAFEQFMQSMDNKPSGKKISVKKKLNQEASEASVQGGQAFGADGIGPTFAVPRAGTPFGFGYGAGYSVGLSESIVTWMKSEKTQQKFADKYGDLWEDKLVEAALRLEETGCGCKHSEKKSMKKLREGMEGGVNNMSPIPTQRKDDEQQLHERGADSKGLYRSTESGAGLTRKGAKKFGIKTAVTTPPSKLDPKGKAAKRRKSFCARMGGMKGPMKDEKGRPTRKAMSLRRWNCEE
jgi:cytidyltransferase-like protein